MAGRKAQLRIGDKATVIGEDGHRHIGRLVWIDPLDGRLVVSDGRARWIVLSLCAKNVRISASKRTVSPARALAARLNHS